MLVVKNPPANAGDVRDVGFIPGAGRSSGDGHSNPLQYSFLENSTDRGAWQASPWEHSWSNLACVVSLNKNKKNKFILPFFILSQILFLSLHRLRFLTYIISFVWRTSFKYFFQSGSTTGEYHQLLSEKIFISHLVLKDSFSGYRILRLFSLLSPL